MEWVNRHLSGLIEKLPPLKTSLEARLKEASYSEAQKEDLFESLVANVSIPGRPRQQHHDLQKRQLGRQNRLVA